MQYRNPMGAGGIRKHRRRENAHARALSKLTSMQRKILHAKNPAVALHRDQAAAGISP